MVYIGFTERRSRPKSYHHTTKMHLPSSQTGLCLLHIIDPLLFLLCTPKETPTTTTLVLFPYNKKLFCEHFYCVCSVVRSFSDCEQASRSYYNISSAAAASFCCCC